MRSREALTAKNASEEEKDEEEDAEEAEEEEDEAEDDQVEEAADREAWMAERRGFLLQKRTAPTASAWPSPIAAQNDEEEEDADPDIEAGDENREEETKKEEEDADADEEKEEEEREGEGAEAAGAIFQTRTDRSLEAVTSHSPQGEESSARTTSLWPGSSVADKSSRSYKRTFQICCCFCCRCRRCLLVSDCAC